MPQDFLTDIKTLRERARKHIENGAVTEGYKADRETVIRLLNEALATEIVCVLRYKLHYFMAQGIHSQAVAAEFLEHANEEQGHADQIAGPHRPARGQAEHEPGGPAPAAAIPSTRKADTLVDMIKENLVAERIAIESYARDGALLRRRRPDLAPADREHPGRRGGARRRPRQPARDARLRQEG